MVVFSRVVQKPVFQKPNWNRILETGQNPEYRTEPKQNQIETVFSETEPNRNWIFRKRTEIRKTRNIAPN